MNRLRRKWWVVLLILACSIPAFYMGYKKWGIFCCVASFLYLGFGWVQFYAVTRMEQGKMLFKPFTYVISSKEILMKMNTKQGMPIGWDQIQKVKLRKKEFLFQINKAQFILLPYRIFKSEHHVKFIKHLLKRKKMI